MPAGAAASGDVFAGVRRPGLAAQQPQRQRLALPGGGAVLIDLGAGDELRVVSSEGGQGALLVCLPAADAFSAARRCPLDLGQATPAATDAFTAATLADCLNDELRAALRRLRRDLSDAQGFNVLEAAAPPGSSRSARAREACLLLVAAPLREAGSDGLRLGSPLELEVWRAALPQGTHAPPPPLSEALDDWLLPRRTARAYEVKAGQFIQIVDIEGRQCSDFIAFARRQLDRGVERFIDGTVTRTLVRAAYPRPGLADKFYDQDMQPLLRMVQDTCGRHDTFGLACTRRTYDAYGMPGHDNCSDNISRAGAPYGVAERLAWPAVNLFFNTAVDQGNAISSDEGWSRPGDYVLLQALTDLVCVSTACPDDTSPINGWDPSDIQVRLYDETQLFKRSVAFRMTPDATPVLTRETAFHPRTSALTRHYAVAKDCWVAQSFSNAGVTAEYWATRDAATLQDLSQLRKFDVCGPDAESLLDWALTRDVRRQASGQVLYALACRATGAMFDDGTLFRLGPNTFRWMCGDARMGEWLREQARAKGFNAQVHTVTETLHNLALQGPLSRDILSSLIWTPDDQPRLAELKFFRFLVGRIGGAMGAPVLVSRTGYTGELGFEVFCQPQDALTVWDAIMAGGAPRGLIPMGSAALELLRIEAALPAAGAEYTEEIDPFEAGCSFAVALDKQAGDFLGRDALRRSAAAPRKQLIGLKLEGRETARHGDGVFIGQTRIGSVTSACISPMFGVGIALARVSSEAVVSPGAPQPQLEIGSLDQQRKRLLASRVELPFYASKLQRR
jgi:aminomethyltransferase